MNRRAFIFASLASSAAAAVTMTRAAAEVRVIYIGGQDCGSCQRWRSDAHPRWLASNEASQSLKTFAVSRLLFDNVPHVKCFWVMHGLSLAQLSLNFGVDDLDGSVVEYKITHDADAYGTPDTMHREDLLQLIWDAGFQPVERNTHYQVVREYEPPVSLEQRRAEPQQVWV